MARFATFKYGSGIKYGTQPLPGADSITIDYVYLDELNLYFRRMKNWLVDDRIYDKQPIAVPFQSIEYRFSGVTGPEQYCRIYLNDKLITSVFSRPDNTFEFYLNLRRGENKVQADTIRISDSQLIVSNILYINTYNFYLWLASYADEFSRWWGDLNTKKNNVYLKSADELGLRNNFAIFTVIQRPELYGPDEFRNMLRATLMAHSNSTTWESFDSFTFAFCARNPVLTEYYRDSWMPSSSDLKFWVDRITNGTPTLICNWNSGQVWIGGALGFVLDGSDTVVDDTTSFLYVDGDKDPNGYLTVKQSLVEPTDGVILAAVSALGGDITYIDGCKRIGVDAYYRSNAAKVHIFEVAVDATGLVSAQKDTIEAVYKLLRPAHKVCYLKFSDESYSRAV